MDENKKVCGDCAYLVCDPDLGYMCSDDSGSLMEGCCMGSDIPSCEWFAKKECAKTNSN